MLLQNPKIQYHAHTNMPLNSTSSNKPDETSAHPNIYVNIIFPSMPNK